MRLLLMASDEGSRPRDAHAAVAAVRSLLGTLVGKVGTQAPSPPRLWADLDGNLHVDRTWTCTDEIKV